MIPRFPRIALVLTLASMLLSSVAFTATLPTPWVAYVSYVGDPLLGQTAPPATDVPQSVVIAFTHDGIADGYAVYLDDVRKPLGKLEPVGKVDAGNVYQFGVPEMTPGLHRVEISCYKDGFVESNKSAPLWLNVIVLSVPSNLRLVAK